MALKILAPAAWLSFLCLVHSQSLLEEYASWTYLDFANNTFPTTIRENGIITGLQVSPTRIFLTIPRLRPGVPATLASIPRSGGPYANKTLEPFPSWEWQNGFSDECYGLVSVFRSRLDPCGNLWVLDTGSVNALDDFQQLCPPKLIAFDANGNEVFRVIIPEEVLTPNSLLVSLALDRRGPYRLQNCLQTNELVIYISDIVPGVIVYDHQNQTFWRQEHPYMQPDPKFANYSIAGENFYLEDGVVGMTVGIYKLTKVLYFQPLASKSTYAIQTSLLMDPEVCNLNAIRVFDKVSQSAGLIADGMSRLFYSQVSQTDVVEWNPILSTFRTLAVDSQRLQFVSDYSIDNQGTLWMVSNRFQAYFNSNYSSSSPNMRVMRLPRAANILYS